jgi:hypothetical protein
VAINVINDVLRYSKSVGAARLVLVTLAWFAREDGRAWPSVASIQARSKVGERSVHRALKELEALGELYVSRFNGPMGCNLYHIQITQTPAKVAGGDNPSPVLANQLNWQDPPAKVAPLPNWQDPPAKVAPNPLEEIRQGDPFPEDLSQFSKPPVLRNPGRSLKNGKTAEQNGRADIARLFTYICEDVTIEERQDMYRDMRVVELTETRVCVEVHQALIDEFGEGTADRLADFARKAPGCKLCRGRRLIVRSIERRNRKPVMTEAQGNA